jgi:hypothetical protein
MIAHSLRRGFSAGMQHFFPTGYSGISRVNVGAWRDDRGGPMEVVSGPVGKERLHFVAPLAGNVKNVMRSFLKWHNAKAEIDPVLKASLAHLGFVTIHPFDDGNGRIARAIADLGLARSEGSTGSTACPLRFGVNEMLITTFSRRLKKARWM